MVCLTKLLGQCLLITLVAYNTEGIPSCTWLFSDTTEWYKYSFHNTTFNWQIQTIRNPSKIVKLTKKCTKRSDLLLHLQSLLKVQDTARVTLGTDYGYVICDDSGSNFLTLMNSKPKKSRSAIKHRPLENNKYTEKQVNLLTEIYKWTQRKSTPNISFLAAPAKKPRPYIRRKRKAEEGDFFDFLKPIPTPEEKKQSSSLAGVSLNLPQFLRTETINQVSQPTPPVQSSSKEWQSVSECGRRDSKYDIGSRIYGGEEIERGSWPWLAAIYQGGRPDAILLCGGTLVSSKAVITAGHCFSPMSFDFVFVSLGRHDIRNLVEEGSVLQRARVIVHPHYGRNLTQDNSFDADLAILQLSDEVRFSEFIQPACLWSPTIYTSDIIGRTGLVAGWGQINNNEFQSTPKQTMVDVVSNEVCFEQNPFLLTVTSARNFCAGRLDGTGPCKGDSGGGLLFNEGSRWTLRGIVSVISNTMIAGCDLKSSYVVYTDIAQFRIWIDDLIK